jgi:hypothetical protein
MHFKHLIVNIITNLPYKKFRTNYPNLNQNYSYIISLIIQLFISYISLFNIINIL